MAKFEVFKDKKNEFRWRLRHENGNVIADSGEGYTAKDKCLAGIESVKKNAPTGEVVELAATPK